MNKEQLNSLYKIINNSIYESVFSKYDMNEIYSMFNHDNTELFSDDNINNEKDKNEKIVKPKINAKLI